MEVDPAGDAPGLDDIVRRSRQVVARAVGHAAALVDDVLRLWDWRGQGRDFTFVACGGSLGISSKMVDRLIVAAKG